MLVYDRKTLMFPGLWPKQDSWTVAAEPTAETASFTQVLSWES